MPQRTAVHMLHITGEAQSGHFAQVQHGAASGTVKAWTGTALPHEDVRRQGEPGLTGLMAPLTPLRMVKGRLWLFITLKPISADCMHNSTC